MNFPPFIEKKSSTRLLVQQNALIHASTESRALPPAKSVQIFEDSPTQRVFNKRHTPRTNNTTHWKRDLFLTAFECEEEKLRKKGNRSKRNETRDKNTFLRGGRGETVKSRKFEQKY